MSRPSTRVAAGAFVVALLLAPVVQAAPIVFDGEVPADGPDHFFLDFEVPEGTQEIEVRHSDRSDANTLDFGLNDPAGYRGWGGGTGEKTVVNTVAASRAYVPGPITPGTWRVIVGKALIAERPARYHVEVDLRQEATLQPVPRSPYVPAPARKTGTRYYAGDLHVHSRESTDAGATLAENIAYAKGRGLEWLEISDHNTITQLDFFNAAQEAEPDFLLVPGIEFTTYQGHANAIGATRWVDHKIGQPGVTIDSAADAIIAQGAILSINHPLLDVGGLCIGCTWHHQLDPRKIGGVEIGTLGIKAGAVIFVRGVLKFWDDLLDTGAHIAGIGGSDDHQAGRDADAGNLFPAQIGSPTTMVRATELSAQGILDGIKKGATVVKLDSPLDPMVELEATAGEGGEGGAGDAVLAYPGDTIGVRSVILRATVTGGAGHTVRFVKNGKAEDAVPITGDPFVHTIVARAPEAGEERWRAEVLVEELPRTVTSHVWLHLDPGGPAVPEPPAPRPADDDGCALRRSVAGDPSPAALVLGALALAALRRRRR